MRQLTVLGSKPGLERISSLLREMGNPQQGLKYVHVAGTNGKGSVSYIMTAILMQTGCRVGRFTSPHLHSYRERFTVDGVQIGEAALASILDEIEGHIRTLVRRGEDHPTEFEVLTAAAFRFFQEMGVDIAVLEVGMGGTYDSTNIIIPLVSVITGVDFDHVDFLGSTLGEIAANKAGIIKTGVPVVTGRLEPEAWEVIKDRAHALGASLHQGNEISIIPVQQPELGQQLVNIEGAGLSMNRVKFSLSGTYQLINLAVALRSIMLLKEQGYDINEDKIRIALARLNIPGRLEVVQKSPLVIVDAAHNPQGAAALADSLDILLPRRKKILAVGLLDDKDWGKTLNYLGRNTRVAIITRPAGPRSQTWYQLEKRWQQVFPAVQVMTIEDIVAAVNEALTMVGENEYLLITGSFYVLDRARRIFINN